jgi:ribosomal protein RSM22 (predicted rRNA methylase)
MKNNTDLRQAAEEISQRYRLGEKPYLTRKEHYLAYLITRYPATLAAISQVFKTVKNFSIESILDLGAGPGTGWVAAQNYFPMLKQATLLETDPEFIALGQQNTDERVTWQEAHLPCTLTPHDLVLMSYSLNEMPDPEEIIHLAFAATKKLLVIIEPGTPEGYARIIKIRTQLLDIGAHIVAPCPNALPCPMQSNDWCHFPARVERSAQHRQLKGGTLGYEDEKFSYLIVSKEKVETPCARLVAPTAMHGGHVQLTLCTQGHIEKKTVSKK